MDLKKKLRIERIKKIIVKTRKFKQSNVKFGCNQVKGLVLVNHSVGKWVFLYGGKSFTDFDNTKITWLNVYTVIRTQVNKEFKIKVGLDFLIWGPSNVLSTLYSSQNSSQNGRLIAS